VPFLQILLARLRAQGIGEVILGTGYLAEQVEAHFGDGQAFGLTIAYSRESAPLGTGGALKLAEKQLSDPVLILNGDSFVEWELASLVARFEEKKADLVMALQAVSEVTRYGSVTLAEDGRVADFVEKGTRTGPGLINAGVYLLRKKILADLPNDQPISLERDVFPKLLQGPVYGVVSEGLFIDIGVPQDLERAQTLLA
ncbi:MAG: sugar phosphate nucleotidyltransferase, partial [Chthoniobacterales bacterium]